MPFKPQYKTGFDDGDLVYGIREKRTALVIHLGGEHVHRKGDFPRTPMTIDQLDTTKAKGLSESERMWKQLHQDIGSHPKYALYTRVTKSGTVSDEELQTSSRIPEFIADSAIRRKCKFGLYWTIKNGFHIHFCLDGLNMAQITTKGFKTDKPNGRKPVGSKETLTKLRAVTGAELRWIYRHRNVLEVQQHVQFWLGNQPAGPPWDEPQRQEIVGSNYVRWRDLWSRYLPTKVPSSLELDTDDAPPQVNQKAPMVLKRTALPRCSECGAADEDLLQAPNGALVCDPCRLAGLQQNQPQVQPPPQGNAQPLNDPLRCSHCQKQRASQSSWFWNRWHECQSCERIYCNSCGAERPGDYLGAVGQSLRVQRFCACGGETELIY